MEWRFKSYIDVLFYGILCQYSFSPYQKVEKMKRLIEITLEETEDCQEEIICLTKEYGKCYIDISALDFDILTFTDIETIYKEMKKILDNQ